MESEEIKIPNAYTPLEKWKAEHPGKEPGDEDIRILLTKSEILKASGYVLLNLNDRTESQSGKYVIDKKNSKLKRQLNKWRSFARELSRILEEYFECFELPFTTQRGKTNKQKIHISIAPPYFKSLADDSEKSTSRVQSAVDTITVVVHLDEKGTLQLVRGVMPSYFLKNKELYRKAEKPIYDMADMVEHIFRLRFNGTKKSLKNVASSLSNVLEERPKDFILPKKLLRDRIKDLVPSVFAA